MNRFLIFCALSLVGVGSAKPHDKWGNGEPVPVWVKKACCGPEDVHHLRPDQVHIIETNGVKAWKVDIYPDPIPIGKEQPSADGDYWIFFRILNNGDVSMVYCFFAPLNRT
jgi:hypothetical protein